LSQAKTNFYCYHNGFAKVVHREDIINYDLFKIFLESFDNEINKLHNFVTDSPVHQILGQL